MERKVLIVDDDPDVLESTAMLVESLGYEPMTLSDPAEVLETAEQEQPDVLLQDLRMPDLNVSGLIACLRLSPATDDMPIVFVSAAEELSTVASRYDAWGYIAKPFGKEELAQVLEEAIHGSDDLHIHAGRDLQREVRRIFHEQWNLLAAVSNYIEVIESSEELSSDLEPSVQGLRQTVLQLEARTERLQSYLLTLVSAMQTRSSQGSESDSDAVAGSS